MSDRVVAVIGSNCFTGSHIVDALLGEARTRVVAISRSPEYAPLFLPYKRHTAPDLTFHRIDFVREFDALRRLLDETRPSVVINVAALSEVALSHERPIDYFHTNTVGVARICDHLRRASYLDRYVHISSAEIFGACERAVDEGALFNPSTPYAVSKAAADMYISTLIRHFNFPAVIIRSTNVYGRHQQLFKIIPRTVINLKLGRPIELHGGGLAVKSFIQIRDVVSGLILAIDKGARGTFHFTEASADTVADVVRKTCELMGHDFRRATRTVGERLGQDARYWLSCGKAEQELGWKPAVAFEEGVREVIEWIERNWDEIRQQPLTYQHRT